jgi:hypothetical protein
MHQVPRALALGVGHVVLPQLSVEEIPSQRLGPLALLGAHKVTNLGLCRRGLDELDPVFGRLLVRTRDDLDGVTVA